MHTHRLNNVLIRPSLSSGMLCALVATIVPIAVNWSFILRNFLFYDYFFGSDGIVTNLQIAGSGSSTQAIGRTLTSDQLHHTLSIIGGALLAGVGLFVAIRVVSRLVGTISVTLKEMNAVDTPAKHAVEREMSRRLVIRAIVLALWGLYTMIFIKAIVPFAILSSQIGLAESSPVSTGIYYTLFAGLLLFCTVHVHIVMARLFLLRPRIFGGEDAIIGS